jgi:hypothetical protein
MARSRSTRTEKPAPADSDIKVTPEEAKIENISSEPANIEVETPSTEAKKATEAPAAEKIQTDVREKLAKKSVDQDVFVPANPVALEKAAEAVAQAKGFDFNRGTSIGARLMARANKSI